MYDDTSKKRVLDLKGIRCAKTHKLLVIFLAVAMLIMPLMIGQGFGAGAATENQKFVHTVTYSQGGLTYIEKPVFPVEIKNASVPIGVSWTIICPLVADHSYHVYCYGDWVHTGSAPKTDYDIYVYNPSGNMESSHTEAAGLPEHLGTTVEAPYFTAQSTGNYTFVVNNDSRESNGTEAATFMIIENIDCDKWYSQDVKGKQASSPVLQTSWAYEFMTNSSQFEIYVKVPNTLDMYEARLYCMSDSDSISVNNISLPWEPGLYGNGTNVGGYNLESEGYRGIKYASCEYMGQDMYLNYSVPTTVKDSNETVLYHLVLMGEVGEGTVEFLVKTNFGGDLTQVSKISRVTPDKNVIIEYNSTVNPLTNAVLEYTTSDWQNQTSIIMVIDGSICNATIPRQPAGSIVEYRIKAFDLLENNLTATGEYGVKQNSQIFDFNTPQESVLLGNNITFTGTISSEAASGPISIQFLSANDTQTIKCECFDDGTFTCVFQPTCSGTWTAQAMFLGTQETYETNSQIVMFEVLEPNFVQKNALYIGVVFAVIIAVFSVVVYIKNKRS